MCDAGGPNQLADHHWKSGTLDSPWHPDKGYPFKNAPFGAFFCLDFPVPLIFISGGEVARGGWFYCYWGAQFQPKSAPRSPSNTSIIATGNLFD